MQQNDRANPKTRHPHRGVEGAVAYDGGVSARLTDALLRLTLPLPGGRQGTDPAAADTSISVKLRGLRLALSRDPGTCLLLIRSRSNLSRSRAAHP
jgi:hypothetical protein